MDWTQAFAIMGVFVAAFLYMMGRMDSNRKHSDEKFEQMNQKFQAIDKRFNGIENRMTSMEAELKATNQRISDFKTDVNQRLSTIEGYLVPRKVFRFEEVEHKEDPKEN